MNAPSPAAFLAAPAGGARRASSPTASRLRPGTGSDGREDVLRAAAELFTEYGYAATSIDAVADRLGATKGRIYHYYRSKADLFFDVQIAAMRLITDQVAPLTRSPAEPAPRLLAMSLRHARVLLHDMTMQKVAVQGLERHLLGAAAARHAGVLESILALRDAYEAMFVQVIEQGMASGDFVRSSRGMSTKAFFGALNWATIWYRPRPGQPVEAIDDLAWSLACSAVRGLLTEQGAAVLKAQFEGPRPADTFVGGLER